MTRYRLKPITENIIPLTELTIARNDDENVKLQVDKEVGRIGDWYFKFVGNTDYTRAEKIARIKFEFADYVFHGPIKLRWLLNSSQCKLLVKMLMLPFISTEAEYEYLTKMRFNNWIAGMYVWNFLMSDSTIPVQNFTNLTRSSPWYDPKYIPIADILKKPMPNYRELVRYTRPEKGGFI